MVSLNRRRLSYYNSAEKKLLFFITSESDIDDIVNALIALHLETRKMHHALVTQKKYFDEHELINLFGCSAEELENFKQILGSDWRSALASWAALEDQQITLATSTDSYYWPFEQWVDQLAHNSLFFDLLEAPVYFVSSNTHSLTNLITGYVWSIEGQIFSYIEKKYPELYTQWLSIKNHGTGFQVYDLVYYLSKIYFEDLPDQATIRDQKQLQQGIRRLVSDNAFATSTQIIPVASIPQFAHPDPQIANLVTAQVKNSKAIIINIEYPLGQSAHYLMNTIFKYFKNIKGIYIIGKAAILNGNIGDIQIPQIVKNERSSQTFTFDNIFNQIAVESSSVRTLASLKAISLYGTFLENKPMMEQYQKDGFNVIEMESGPYLESIAAHNNQKETITNLPFELGIINYASDNPLVTTLGDTPLSVRGIEPTYSATSAVIRRIVALESST